MHLKLDSKTFFSLLSRVELLPNPLFCPRSSYIKIKSIFDKELVLSVLSNITFSCILKFGYLLCVLKSAWVLSSVEAAI